MKATPLATWALTRYPVNTSARPRIIAPSRAPRNEPRPPITVTAKDRTVYPEPMAGEMAKIITSSTPAAPASEAPSPKLKTRIRAISIPQTDAPSWFCETARTARPALVNRRNAQRISVMTPAARNAIVRPLAKSIPPAFQEPARKAIVWNSFPTEVARC